MMSTKLPRLNVGLEPYVYHSILKLSKKEGLSMSLVARDLLREALILYEDAYWAKEARARQRTFVRQKAVSHNKVGRTAPYTILRIGHRREIYREYE